MLEHAHDLEAGTELQTDLCIVGTGAAGLTIAREFLHRRQRVLLLEGSRQLGCEPPSPYNPNPAEDLAAQALYQGQIGGLLGIIDPDFLTRSRTRALGGSTNCWGGWCRPLDAIDLISRPGFPDNAWPISRQDLDPWYRRAQELAHLDEFVYDDPAYWTQRIRSRPLYPLPHLSGRFRTALIQFAALHFLRFQEVYGPELLAAERVTVLRNAHLQMIDTDTAATRVTRLQVATLADGRPGKHLTVRARCYVLALGGIETVRLLLLSNQVQRTGLGNAHDLLGRGFMVHPLLKQAAHFTYPGGVNPLPQPMSAFYFLEPLTGNAFGTRIFATLAPSEAVLQAEALGNFRIRVQHDPRRQQGVVELCAEQAPHPHNRLTLSPSERDLFGQPKVNVAWRLDDSDVRTLTRALELTQQELRELCCAEHFSVPPVGSAGVSLDTLHPGDHHLGGTRMSDDPTRGVVNRHCRLHQVENLYLASSSVFPSGGYANPTLTILALALRLASHLQAVLAD